ncbi:hypothetical protein ACFX15_019764 [Malus domestica]
MHSQRIVLSYSVFLIPWDTPANNPFKAKVFHIIKVESKSISYHAFSFLLLVPDCLPSLALEYSSSSFARDKEKESKRQALGKIEERNRPKPLPRACPSCRRNKQRRMQLAQSSQQKESEMKN